MSKVKSLQYLLLDTLKKRNETNNKNEINNLAKSLRVNENNNSYEISWIEKFKKKKLEVSKEQFSFYQRNDGNQKYRNQINSLEKNNKISNEIVDKILQQKEIKKKELNFLKKYLTQFFFLSVFFLPLVFFSNIQDKIIAFSIILIMFFDLIEKKKIISHSLLLAITFYKPGEFIFFYSIFLLFFTIFEPGIIFKKMKIIIIIFIIAYNLNHFDKTQYLINIHFFIIVLFIILITVNNFLIYNSNFNWIYCLPFFSLVFFINENLLISYTSLILCVITPYWFNYLDKKIFLK